MASIRRAALAVAALLMFAFSSGEVTAGRVADIRNTKHNLSVNGPGTVKASTETQVCVFCHTPHAATPDVRPLWNRELSKSTYTVYTSSSLDANAVQSALDQPGGSSKLCLSCHDGTLAVSSVNVLNGAGSTTQRSTVSINMSGLGTGGVMPGSTTTGFTRNLGTDLTNDHPISVTFNSTLASRDGELRAVDSNQKWPAGTGTIIGIRSPGYSPKLPLEKTGASNAGQIQCATCHDPHIRETDSTKGNQKFLRLNRFQEQPASANHDSAKDIICLACHDKNKVGGGSWAFSSHANNQVATSTYKATPAADREFPANLQVWQAACLNCHDSHTVPGARRLLREGTDSASSPKSGGNPALEEVCFQCHRASASSALTTAPKDIHTDYSSGIRMPLRGTETHDIGGSFNDGTGADCTTSSNGCGKDFLESKAKLGYNNLTGRHAECTDCHNPHRVVRFRSFIGNGGVLSGTPDASGTHNHGTTGTHSNIASGVLRGSWGVEPKFSGAAANSFHSMPSSFDVKRGDPGASPDTSVSAAWVTREYQVCMKCHSNYSINDNNIYPGGNRPSLPSSTGTAYGTNGLTQFTNIAKEFNSPSSHANEPLSLGTDAGSSDTNFNTNNHRSWHPVVAPTGRTLAKRGITSTNPWLAPWNNANAVGAQTMYCTDCHGSNTTGNTVAPDTGKPWGPHGSANNFLLKGVWDAESGATGRDSGVTANLLCFKCHAQAVYSTRNDSGRRSGFYNSSRGNLHNYHIDKMSRLECTWCHVAVPHGWKNKALLVNLNDVGEEAGQGAGSSKEVNINGNSDYYTREPYYLEAKLKVVTFAQSGSWSDSACGSRNKTSTNRINSTNGATSNNTNTGKNWMTSVCTSPP